MDRGLKHVSCCSKKNCLKTLLPVLYVLHPRRFSLSAYAPGRKEIIKSCRFDSCAFYSSNCAQDLKRLQWSTMRRSRPGQAENGVCGVWMRSDAYKVFASSLYFHQQTRTLVFSLPDRPDQQHDALSRPFIKSSAIVSLCRVGRLSPLSIPKLVNVSKD